VEKPFDVLSKLIGASKSILKPKIDLQLGPRIAFNKGLKSASP
jgi:hypothetical protein